MDKHPTTGSGVESGDGSGAGKVLAGVAVCALLLAGHFSALCYNDRTARSRSTANLEQAPAAVTFTSVVLGGFRGILADILWIRASYLQDTGQYVELVQLSDWITKLEPETAEIWEYHAWNMAYNVSVFMPDDENRWRWVQSGIRLLRDEGLRYNPGDPQLYAQLAWIYQHKVAGFTDTANGHYKRTLAARMESLCPGGRPPYRDAGAMERLRAAERLSPARMLEIEQRTGPLDWRVPETLAIYWSYEGTLAPRGRGTMMCRRILYQSLASSFFRGTLAPSKDGNTDVRLTRTSLARPALSAFLEVLSELPNSGMEETVSNFVHDAILVHNAFGNTPQAQELFDLMRSRYPDANLGATPAEYCSREPAFTSAHAHGAESLALVEGYLDRHWRAVAKQDKTTADAAWRVADGLWKSFEKRTSRNVLRRFDIPPFAVFARAVFERSLGSAAPPERRLLELDWRERMGSAGGKVDG